MKLVEIELEEGLGSWQTDVEDTGEVAAESRKRAEANVSPRCETTSMSKAASRKYPPKDVKILYGAAAARCAFETCRRDIVLQSEAATEQKQIGKIAHIVAHSDDGPRGDATYPREQLDTYDNWILLCPTCHDTIDQVPTKYPVVLLRNIKRMHEQWVKERLKLEVANIGFAELEVVVAVICGLGKAATQDLTLTAPLAKIQKNNLIDNQFELTMGLSKAHEVAQYVDHMAAIDSTFPERLTAGFVNEYVRLQAAGLSGSLLFNELMVFAGGAGGDFKRKAAGLVVLTYLFERCEIFEK